MAFHFRSVGDAPLYVLLLLWLFVPRNAPASGNYADRDSALVRPEKGRADSARIVTLDKMVVTANPIKEYAPSKVTLDAKDFSGKYLDLQSVLETVSGLTVTTMGGFGHYSDVSIRGSSPSQVQVYLDGIPLNGATGNAVDISKIPFASLQTISIYKTTPSIEIFGDNAGGVIDLTTEPGKDATTASMGVGSFGYRDGSAMICKTIGPMVHRLSVDYGYADNNYPYTDSLITRGPTVASDDSQRTMDNNFYSSFSSVYSNTFTINARNKLTSQFSAVVTDEGIFYLPEAGKNDGSVRDSKLSFLESFSTIVDSNISITVTAKGKTEDNLLERFQPFYLTPPGGGSVQHDISQPFGSLESLLRDSLADYATITGLLSASYDGYDYDNLLWPSAQLRPQYTRLTGKAGIETDIDLLKDVSARIGGLYRYEIDSTNDSMPSYGLPLPRGRRSKEGFPGGFGELQYRICDGLGAEAGVQYSSRSPGFSEKYSEGANVSANPSLRPETRFEADAGVSYLGRGLAVSSDFFFSSTNDKIVYTMTSNMFTPKNMSNVKGLGLENDITLFPFSWLSIVNSLTLMKNVITKSVVSGWVGMEEPLLPECKDNLEVKLTFRSLYVSHSIRFASRYFIDYGNTIPVYVRPQLNAGIGCTPGEHFDISYRIENYLNVEDYDFQRPLPGLTQYVSLKYRW